MGLQRCTCFKLEVSIKISETIQSLFTFKRRLSRQKFSAFPSLCFRFALFDWGHSCAPVTSNDWFMFGWFFFLLCLFLLIWMSHSFFLSVPNRGIIFYLVLQVVLLLLLGSFLEVRSGREIWIPFSNWVWSLWRISQSHRNIATTQRWKKDFSNCCWTSLLDTNQVWQLFRLFFFRLCGLLLEVDNVVVKWHGIINPISQRAREREGDLRFNKFSGCFCPSSLQLRGERGGGAKGYFLRFGKGFSKRMLVSNEARGMGGGRKEGSRRGPSNARHLMQQKSLISQSLWAGKNKEKDKRKHDHFSITKFFAVIVGSSRKQQGRKQQPQQMVMNSENFVHLLLISWIMEQFLR